MAIFCLFERGKHSETLIFNRLLMAQHDTIQIRNRGGNCYDNAHAKSFSNRYNLKLLGGVSSPGSAEANLEISHHIAFYNAERRHSVLAYQSLNRFETQFQTTSQFCPA